VGVGGGGGLGGGGGGGWGWVWGVGVGHNVLVASNRTWGGKKFLSNYEAGEELHKRENSGIGRRKCG